MNGLVLNRIPGLTAALAKARLHQSRMRENAWKNLPREILGVSVRMMTVRDYVILDHFGSPFLYRLAPQMCDLTFLCWCLSPECGRWNEQRSQFGRTVAAFLFSRRVKKRFQADLPVNHAGKICFQAAVKAAFEYIEEMFLDAPPSVRNGTESGLCYLASWFDLIQGEHHLEDEQIWTMPLAQLFQRVAAIRQRKGEKVPMFSRAEDRIKAFIQNGITTRKFTMEDLAAGRVDFSHN